MKTNYPQIGIGVMIENEKGEVLLGKRKGSHGEGEWCFPGGRLEFGETIFECAIRETKEECGLSVKDCELISVFDEFDYIESSGKHWVNIGVKAKYEGGEPECMESDKCEEWKWFSLDHLPKPLYSTIPYILENYKNDKVYKERMK